MSRSFIWLLLCSGCVINSGATEFAKIATDPAKLAFDSTASGQSETKSVTITNQSSFSVRIGSLTAQDAGPWSVDLGSEGVVLGAGASTQIALTFAPASTPGITGYGATWVFTQYEPSTGTPLGGTFGVRLSGTGTAPVPDAGQDTVSGLVSAPGVLADWSQNDFACSAARLIDAGPSCMTPLDCPTACCPCGADGGEYRAGACVLGQCLPQLECDAARLGASAFCAAPLAPNALEGALGFAIAGAWSRYSSTGTLTIVLSGAVADGCAPDAGVGDLAVTLETQAQPLAPGAWPLAGNAALGLLTTDAGTQSSEAGTLLLTSVNDGGISGDFELAFAAAFPIDGGTSTLSGAFTARLCPSP